MIVSETGEITRQADKEWQEKLDKKDLRFTVKK